MTAGEGEIAAVREALGRTPDIVYECIGSEGALAKAAADAGPYGTVTSLGFCTPDTFNLALAACKCITVQFRVGYTMRDFFDSADMLDIGAIDPTAIITRTIGLDALPATFAALRGPNAETKVHVVM